MGETRDRQLFGLRSHPRNRKMYRDNAPLTVILLSTLQVLDAHLSSFALITLPGRSYHKGGGGGKWNASPLGTSNFGGYPLLPFPPQFFAVIGKADRETKAPVTQVRERGQTGRSVPKPSNFLLIAFKGFPARWAQPRISRESETPFQRVGGGCLRSMAVGTPYILYTVRVCVVFRW
ncbi:hypothetical protein F5X96DRAFT_80812 [Biscogniauxia mediterranea]|nr:hypothetical protein F5X96DRAFT_80812 [Biscogniauxia mediterranea]